MGSKDSATRREMPIELKGKQYTIRELDLKQYGQVENFVKAKHARLFRESAVGMDAKEVNEGVMEIIRSSFTPEELAAEMDASDCMTYVAYLALSHNPGIDQENFEDIVDLSNVGEVVNAINALGGVEDSENPPAPPAETASTPGQ